MTPKDPIEGKPAPTPNADMQAEDSGTEASDAQAGETDSGTAATRAMKQTSKTDAESGGNKR